MNELPAGTDLNTIPTSGTYTTTPTVTNAPSPRPIKTLQLKEFHELMRGQGVPAPEHCAFICPMCKTIQSGADLIAAGAGANLDEVGKYLGFSCVGRFTNAGRHKKDRPPGHGCDWTLGGLFQIHKLEVILEDGKSRPVFELATPEQAQAHCQSQI